LSQKPTAELLIGNQKSPRSCYHVAVNGQLHENPCPELVREIIIKKFSGRLKLEFNKIKVAVYFRSGTVHYAASNVRTLRLGEYLIKSQLVTAEDLRYLGSNIDDFNLAKTLISEKWLSQAQLEQQQVKQASDVLRLVLLWTEGSWDFDDHSHLLEEVHLPIDFLELLIESSRRLPPKFTATRFMNNAELISPVASPPKLVNLLPTEVFLLSRVDAPMTLSELVAVSGLPESDTLRVVYSLSLVGLLTRQYWKPAFRGSLEGTLEVEKVEQPVVEESVVTEPLDTVEDFLARLASANSHYEILGVEKSVSMPELKKSYYDIARKYHPDRFRGADKSLVSRIESSFARITQAYDTLRDAKLRASYDAKLDAHMRAARLAESAPKATASRNEDIIDSSDEIRDEGLTPTQLAEIQFKKGFAALELGDRNVAVGLLGSAARTVAHEPRYRAYYGRALALHESTRRLAEAELQAAVKLEPTNAEYRIMLAELYRDLGFQVRARSEAERALAADSNSRKAKDLLDSLT
jgi:curved DNA-binding protein CbpA